MKIEELSGSNSFAAQENETYDAPPALAPSSVKGRMVGPNKSVIRKAADLFLEEDPVIRVRNVRDRVIKPGIRSLLGNALLGMIYGENAPKIGGFSGGTDYNRIYNTVHQSGKNSNAQTSSNLQARRRSNSIIRIAYETEEDANEVLRKMRVYCDKYSWVELSRMYEWSRVPTRSTDNNWGWRDLRYADSYMDPSDGCWYLRLPAMVQLK